MAADQVNRIPDLGRRRILIGAPELERLKAISLQALRLRRDSKILLGLAERFRVHEKRKRRERDER